jgi:serine/threonine protein kinase
MNTTGEGQEARGSDIFVSYSRSDLVWRDRIVEALRELAAYRDARIFIDADIPPGEEWGPKLQEAMDRAKVALFLVSKAWLRSAECRAELERCRARKDLRIAWVALDRARPKDLTAIQSVGNPAEPLTMIREGGTLKMAVRLLCQKVLDQVDPMWDQLQARLPVKYRLIRYLGGGSMAAVYLAGDLSLDRRVVIRAARSPEDNPDFDATVHRAVQVARHPAIVPIYGAWLDRDPHCCVVDFLEGRSMRWYLEKGSAVWDARDAVSVLLRLGEALVKTHARGIHLRDLRPSKILMDHNSDAYICGLAKSDSRVGAALLDRVKSGWSLSPEEIHYLVPEHCYPLGGPGAEDQSDQYLLGLVAYEMLTRRLPRTVENADEIARGAGPRFVTLQPLHEQREQVPSCPLRLSETIERMTRIDPRDRFANLSDALVILRELESIDLILARESYLRCIPDDPSNRSGMSEEATKFFACVYESLGRRCSETAAMFDKVNQGPGWSRLHVMLKESLLLLFAYAGTPESARREPNVLSRIASYHGAGGPRSLKAGWYDAFLESILDAVKACDPQWELAAVQPFIGQAWRWSLQPGLAYLKSHCGPSHGSARPGGMAAPLALGEASLRRLEPATGKVVV